MPTPRAAEIVLTADERVELEGWARRRTSAAGLAMRSRIVLAAADGGSNTELAQRLGLSITTVRRWRNRFVTDRCDGLLDEPRPGRPRVVGDEQIKDLITATLETMLDSVPEITVLTPEMSLFMRVMISPCFSVVKKA